MNERRPFTKEHKKRISESLKGHKHSEETKRKIGLGNQGKVRSKEERKNLSRKLKGRHISPKTEFKKGQKAWNYEGKGRLKRKYKRFNGKLILYAHYIWLKHNNLKEIPKGYAIHHKDGNTLNDNIENLALMKESEHKSLHNKLSMKRID